MSVKAKPQHLYKPEDGTLGRSWVYVCAHPLHHVEENGFFDTLFGNLMPGDTITVKRFDALPDDPRKSRLLELRRYEVVSLDAGKRHAVVVPNGDFASFVALPLDAPGVTLPDDYAPEGAMVTWNLGRQQHVVSADGVEIFATADKELAHKVAGGEVPIPASSEAA